MLKDNSFWYGYLSNQYENKEDVMQIQELAKNTDKIDAASLKQAARLFLSGNNRITFELLPENEAH